MIYLFLLLAVSAAKRRDDNNALPEESMNTVELCAHYGYPVEVLETTTADGYILTLHRIPSGRNDRLPWKGKNTRPVVFVQHGLIASSADWLLNLPEQSLGFLLADAGFDVWLGNVRGNVYSRGHTNASISKKEYWQFTWDEMAKYDLESMVDKALNVTGQSSLYYVGYSQGTTMMFAKLATDPEFELKIKKFFALAPVTTVGNCRGGLGEIGRRYLPMIEEFVALTGEDEFLPSTFFSKLFSRLVCGVFRFTNPLCENILFLMVGPNSNQLNATRLLVYLSHTPAGTSTADIIHWAQMTRSAKMQMYDYMDDDVNRQHYGVATPPLYNISRIRTPTYLYHSANDWIADAQDVQNLLSELPSDALRRSKNLTDFNHVDFIWGLRATSEIYEEIIEEATEYEMNSTS